jgi:hypothetical protein
MTARVAMRGVLAMSVPALAQTSPTLPPGGHAGSETIAASAGGGPSAIDPKEGIS